MNWSSSRSLVGDVHWGVSQIPDYHGQYVEDYQLLVKKFAEVSKEPVLRSPDV